LIFILNEPAGLWKDSSNLYTLWDTATEPTIDVTLIIENFYRCKDTITVTLNKYVNGITAAIQDDIQVNLFPNPVDGILIIESVSKAGQTISGNIELFDLHGRELLRYPLRKAKEKIDLSALSPGLYIACIEVNGVVERRKVVKR